MVVLLPPCTPHILSRFAGVTVRTGSTNPPTPALNETGAQEHADARAYDAPDRARTTTCLHAASATARRPASRFSPCCRQTANHPTSSLGRIQWPGQTPGRSTLLCAAELREGMRGTERTPRPSYPPLSTPKGC